MRMWLPTAHTVKLQVCQRVRTHGQCWMDTWTVLDGHGQCWMLSFLYWSHAAILWLFSEIKPLVADAGPVSELQSHIHLQGGSGVSLTNSSSVTCSNLEGVPAVAGIQCWTAACVSS